MVKYIVWAIVAVFVIGAGYIGYTRYMIGGSPEGAAQQQEGNLPQVQVVENVVGNGAQAQPGNMISVLYTGKFTDGTVFDSSEANGGQPLVFILGSPGLIPGFQIGINGMKVGGKRTITIPPELAYGNQDIKDAQGNVVIPANSTLVFEVELVKVEEVVDATGGQATPIEVGGQ